MALFTGKGDGGTTKTLKEQGSDKPRISKSSVVPEALGSLDELNAYLGFAKMRAGEKSRIGKHLHEVQQNLFIVQAELAGSEKRLRDNAVAKVEAIVNGIENEIPPVTGFSVAGGTELSALLDVCRTVARRTERRVVAAVESGRALSDLSRSYLNRLSSLLFALARLANDLAGVNEENPHY